MRILMIGDVVGRLGRRAVRELLPQMQREFTLDMVIANGENAAGGRGLTESTANELFDSGVDVITSGNHIWSQTEIYPILDTEAPILRPLNYPPSAPGRGFLIHHGVGVLNLIGRTFMNGGLDCPFRAADEAISQLKKETEVIIVDMHAEATSEKVAMGWHLDGRVTAVLGTHTHVPTADARLLPNGTAYVTDIGMVGAQSSVIGMEIAPILERFLTGLPTKFSPAERGDAIFSAIFLEIERGTGRAIGIQRADKVLKSHGKQN